MTPRLEVRGLRKTYRSAEGWWRFGGGAKIQAVDGVDLTVGQGEVVGLVGESGSGKSTLARLIMRLEQPDDGSIRFDGDELLALRGETLRRRRREFQMVFQDPFGSLNPRMRIGEIVGEPRLVHKMDASKAHRQEMVVELLKRVGLDADVCERFPHAFSGGQRQRIGIARAIACEPTFLVADEPVSALDAPVQAQIVNLLMDLKDSMGLSMLFVAHDLRLVRRICDRVAVMYSGRIVETAPADLLFERPGHPYSRGLLAATPSLDPDAEAPAGLPGEPPDPARRPSGCPFHPRCSEAVEECASREPEWTSLGPEHRVDCRLALKPIETAGRNEMRVPEGRREP